MRNNTTHLDDKYFVRGKPDLRLYVDAFIYDADPEFSTSHDFKASKILANDLLCIYLNAELATLDRKENSMNKNTFIPKGKYVWADSKISLTELIYALHSKKNIALVFINTILMNDLKSLLNNALIIILKDDLESGKYKNTNN
jgi:hypothetical protein